MAEKLRRATRRSWAQLLSTWASICGAVTGLLGLGTVFGGCAYGSPPVTTTRFTGVVTNSAGAGIPGIHVLLSNVALGTNQFPPHTTTGTNGAYAIEFESSLAATDATWGLRFSDVDGASNGIYRTNEVAVSVAVDEYTASGEGDETSWSLKRTLDVGLADGP